jgi:hypothetical protein
MVLHDVGWIALSGAGILVTLVRGLRHYRIDAVIKIGNLRIWIRSET